MGTLALALGPHGLGQKKTLRDGEAESWAQAGRPHRGLEARAAGHTDHRDEKLSCPLPTRPPPSADPGLWFKQEDPGYRPVSETPAPLMRHTASPGILAGRQ